MKRLKQNLTKGEKDMKRRFNGAILALKQNNGATIVTVLVSMFFLLTLTSIMVFMSYTALRIEQTEAAGIRGFYDSEALMDEIKVGMEHTMSEALATAYESVFKTSTTDPNEGATMAETMLKFLDTYSASPDFIIQQGESNGKPVYFYYADFFITYLAEAGVDDQSIFVEGVPSTGTSDRPIHLSGNKGVSSSPIGNVGTIKYDESSVTFEGISVTYIDPDTNIGTKITSDIVVTFGENFLTSTAQAIDFSNAVDFCLVATEDLSATVSTTFNGGIYGNTVSTNGNTNVNETLIAKESLDILTSNIFSLSSTAEIWAGDISLKNDASINSESDSSIYIQNDLALDGNQSSAEINGSLLGFGNSTIDPNESSSILLNGLDTQLDLSGTDFLMLAGHSFIVASEGNSLMGESISARPNQLAYLAPISIFPSSSGIVSNPLVMTTPTDPSDFPDINGVDKNAAIIGANSLNSYSADIMTLTYPLVGTGKSAVYYFITFSDTANANRYFRDYFNTNTSEITGYIEDYAELSTVGGIPQVAGNYIIESNTGVYSLGTQRNIATESAEYVKDSFDNIVKSLSTATTTKPNPFEHLVDTGELEKFITKNQEVSGIYEFKNSSGDVVALVVNKSLAFDDLNRYPDVKLIISTGDVTLNQDFSGLILSDKDITISGSADQISSDPDGVSSAFSATYNGISISELFTIAGTASITGTMEQTEVRDITDMVTYANWTKN